MAEVIIDGTEYHYRISKRAPENGPVAVCVHGSGGDGVVWSYQLSRLSREYRVILPDLPAHGQSGGSLSYHVEGYSAWLDRFADALGLESFILMGHSLGGGIVQHYARSHPARVKGMVLIGTSSRFVLSRQYNETLGLMEEGRETAPETLEKAGALLQNLYSSDYEALAKNGIDVLHGDIVAAGRFDSTPWLDELTMPSLVIAGSFDPIMPCERSRALADGLPDSRFLLLEGAGHTVMLDKKKEFNAAVKEFMDGCFSD